MVKSCFTHSQPTLIKSCLHFELKNQHEQTKQYYFFLHAADKLQKSRLN